ncbi:hypothetical protein Tco_0255481 [Tanacetum coccineum]
MEENGMEGMGNGKRRNGGTGNIGIEGNGHRWEWRKWNGGIEENELVNRKMNHGMNYEASCHGSRWHISKTSEVDNALTWWNTHKRTIGVVPAYAMNWARLMRLMTEVYCPRNEIQKWETEL